jgi:hypothetical protein
MNASAHNFQTAQPERADILTHLSALFPPDFVHPYTDAQIEIAYGVPGRLDRAELFSAFNLEAAADFTVTKNRGGCNVYVGPTLKKSSAEQSSRTTDADFLAGIWTWSDHDAEGDLDRAKGIAGEHGLAPGIIVGTGTVPHVRAHAYFKLAVGVTDCEEMRAINKALQKCLGGDPVQAPSHVMRLAGTVNYPTQAKYGRGYAIEPVTVLVQRWPHQHRAATILGLHPPAGAKANDSRRRSGLGFDLPRNDEELLTLLEASRTGQWHNSMRDAIATMIGRGWTDTAIRLACARYCNEGVTDSDLAPLIDGARKKWDKPNPDDASATETPGANKVPSADPVDLWAKFDPPTLPRGILPPVIEQFAFEQGMDMGADMAGIAVAALAVCAAAIPDKIKLQVKRHNTGWRESARIWVSLVGPPSSKKSPIMTTAVSPLRKLDAEMARQYAERKSAYDKLDKDGKAQIDPPQHTRLLLQDTTIEAAQDILKDSPNGVLCFQDELSGWFGSMDKYSNARGAAKDRAFWLEAFNGAPYSVHRVGRGSVYIENLSASLIGGIQPEPIRKVADDSADDGLLQRLLPVILKPAVEGRDEEASQLVSEYASLIRRLHHLDRPVLGGVVMDFNEALPQGGLVLRFDEKAQAYRQELERRHLELQSCEGINRKLASHIGKYDGIFARLCVVWHCVEAASGTLPRVISEGTARRAGAFLHGFLLPHAIAFYAGVLGLSNDHDRLEAVAGYILARKLERVTNRDIQHGDRTMRGLSRPETEAILDQLDALGWVDRVPGPRPSSPPQWIVNPVVHAKFAQRAAAEAERRARERKIIAAMTKGSV